MHLNNKEYIFWKFVSLSIVLILFTIVFLTLISKNIELYVFLIFVFLSYLFLYFFKKVLQNISFSSDSIFLRPSNSKNCDLCCFTVNVLDLDNSQRSVGFPSGHMTLVTLFCISFLFLLGEKITHFHSFLAFLYVVLMGFSRYKLHCHNITQIIAGIVNGFIIAYFYIYYIKTRIRKIKN